MLDHRNNNRPRIETILHNAFVKPIVSIRTSLFPKARSECEQFIVSGSATQTQQQKAQHQVHMLREIGS